MPTNPNLRIQVQIVTYNSAHCISACLAAVTAQSYPLSSMLVIDNASSDNTLALVESFPDVRIERLDSNTGYAHAHNVGFVHAVEQGIDVVLTLNPDVLLHEDYISEALTAFDDAKVGGATGKLWRVLGKGEEELHLDTTGLVMGAFYHAYDRGSQSIDHKQFDQERHREVWGVCGAAALYRVTMLQDVQEEGKAFEEAFFLYKEDVDLCFCALRLGWRFAYVASATGFHRRGWQKGRPQVATLAYEHSFANQVAILMRHGTWWFPALWLSILLESARYVRMMMVSPQCAQKSMALIRSQWGHHGAFRQAYAERVRARRGW